MNQQARDEAGNIWEVDGAGNPVRLITPAQHAQQGPVTLGTPNPQEQYKAPTAAADLARSQAAAAKAAAETPYAARNAAAATTTAEAIATVDQAKADNVKALNALASMAPNSKLHGEAYFDAIHLPESQRVLARAYARGDLGGRSGGLTTSMLPIIQNAMNYDPTTSATTFPARVKMQTDLAGNTPGTAGGSLRSMEQMLLHGSNLLTSGAALHNYGPGLLGSLGNELRTGYLAHTNDPTLNAYNQEVKNYAPESQKGVAGAAGVGQEREDRAAGYAASLPQAARVAALQADARMALERMGAVNDQYHRLMGKDITDQLSPAAKHAYDLIMSGGYDDNGKAMYPASGYVPGSIFGDSSSGGAPPGSPPPGNTPSGPGPGASLATGATKSGYNKQASDLINSYVRNPNAKIDDLNQALGPMGFGPVAPKQWVNARSYAKAHPNYPGSYGNAVTPEQPTTLLNRVAAGPVGAATSAFANAATGYNLDSIAGLAGNDPANVRAGLDALGNAHNIATPLGEIAGALPLAAGFEAGTGAALGKMGADGLVKYAPLIGDAAYGGFSGAGADDSNRLGGFLGGAATGAIGGMFGRAAARPIAALARTKPVTAAMNGARRAFNMPEVVPPSPLSPAESMVMGAANKAGIPDIQASLGEAQKLGVPMTLADTNPNLRELGAAAVRRSPSASQVAEGALIPRGRGQIERFTQSVNNNLGPTADIPQMGADLTAQARAAAAPLYDQAYAAPGASAVNLSDIIDRPLSMKPGLQRAYTIAKEEGRDPTSLGFDLTPQGEVTLNRVPSFHTLDYVKRGLDDTLEQHRNLLTGKLDLNEATRAINATKNDLLGRIDKVNPAYAQARQAYAGPVQARDALAEGRDAYSMTPDTLRFKLANTSPDLQGQMQLGYRDSLMNQANRVRYNSNPFDATLGNPQAEQRLRIMHPNNPGVDTMLRQRDLESQLARNTNDILGNSKTAQRSIADQQFAGEDWPSVALDAGINLATGQVPTSLFLKKGSAQAVKDMWRMGVGKKAVAKADEMAPILFNTDPVQSAASLSNLSNNLQSYRDFVAAQQQRLAPRFGMFGAALGSSAASRF